ncbi:RNaseH domain-containing protein [Roseibium sp.]|uniref:RNaseH domain-containing protein n=1 Tax=Roseibium sp. TaxID=1936156 RepID=UPI003BAB4D1E
MTNKKAVSIETFPAMLTMEKVSAPARLMSVHWSERAKAAIADLRKKAAETDRKEGKHLPTNSLRALLEGTVSGIWFVDPSVGVFGSDKPFLKVSGQQPECIRKQVHRAVDIWVNHQLADWFDYLEPAESDEDKEFLQQEVDNFQTLLAGTDALEIVEAEQSNLVTSTDFESARDAVVSALSETLSGIELFDGLGPVRRVIQAGRTPLNSIEFETWPIRHKKACYSMVCRIAVETLPGSTKIALIPRVRRRLWMSNLPSGYALSRQRAITTRIMSKENDKSAITSRLTIKNGEISSDFNPLHTLLRLETDGDLSGNIGEQLKATEHANGNFFVGIPHSPRYGKHAIGYGASTRDHIDIVERLENLLVPLGAVRCEADVRSKRLFNIKGQWKDSQLSVEELFIPFAEDLDSMDDPATALSVFTEEYDLATNILDADKLSKLEGKRKSQQQKAARNSERIEKVYGNRGPKLGIIAAQESERVLIRLGVRVLFGDGVNLSEADYSLPPKTHGPAAELHEGKLKSTERYKTQCERWRELAQSLKEDNVTHVLVQAPQHYGNKADDDVNKEAARASLAQYADVNVQYLRPVNDLDPWQKARTLRTKEPEPGFSDYLYRLQSAVYDLFLGHSAAVDPFKETLDKAFPNKETKPDTLLAYAVVSKRKARGGRKRSDLAICLRIKEHERRADACIATFDPQNGRPIIGAWTPFSELLKSLPGLGRPELGNMEERKTVFQELIRHTVDSTLETHVRPLLIFDASQTRSLWPALRNYPEMPPFFSTDGIEQDVLIGSGKYKNIRVVRLDRDMAGHMPTKKSQIDPETGAAFRQDTMVPALAQVTSWKNGGLFWDTPGYSVTNLKRGQSVYRDSTFKREKPDKDGNTTETRAAMVKDPYLLPSVLEISIIKALSGDDLFEVCAALHKLRLLASHHTSTSAMPAPLSFVKKIEDYLPRFDIDETEHIDKRDLTDASIEELEPNEEELAEAITDLEDTLDSETKICGDPPEDDPDGDPEKDTSFDEPTDDNESESVTTMTVDTAETQTSQVQPKVNAVRKRWKIAADWQENTRLLAQEAFKLAEADPSFSDAERLKQIASKILDLSVEYENTPDPRRELKPLVAELKAILEDMPDAFGMDDDVIQYRDQASAKIKLLPNTVSPEMYEAAADETRTVRHRTDIAAEKKMEMQSFMAKGRMNEVGQIFAAISDLKAETLSSLSKIIELLSDEEGDVDDQEANGLASRSPSREMEEGTAFFPNIETAETFPTPEEDGATAPLPQAETTTITKLLDDDSKTTAQQVEFAGSDLDTDDTDEDPFNEVEEDLGEEDNGIPESDALSEIIKGFPNLGTETEMDLDRDIEAIDAIKENLERLVIAGEVGQAYHLRKSADLQYGPENFPDTFTTAELFLISGGGYVDERVYTGSTSPDKGSRKSPFAQTVETAHNLRVNAATVGLNAARRYFLFASTIETALFDKTYESSAVSIVSELIKNGAGRTFYDLANIAIESKNSYRTPSRSDIYGVRANIDENASETSRNNAAKRLEVLRRSRYSFKPAQQVRDHLHLRRDGLLYRLEGAVKNNDHKTAMECVRKFASHDLIETLIESTRKELKIRPIKYGSLANIQSALSAIHSEVSNWFETKSAIEEATTNGDYLGTLSNQLETAINKTLANLKTRRESATTDIERAAISFGLETVKRIGDIVTGKTKPELKSDCHKIDLHLPLLFIADLAYAGGSEPTPYRPDRIAEAILRNEIPPMAERIDLERLLETVSLRAKEGSYNAAKLLLEAARLLGLDDQTFQDQRTRLESGFANDWQNVKTRAEKLKYHVVLMQRFAPDDNTKFNDNEIADIDDSIDDLLKTASDNISTMLFDNQPTSNEVDTVERLNDIFAFKARLSEYDARMDAIITEPRENLRDRAQDAFGKPDSSTEDRQRLEDIERLLDQGDLSTAQERFEVSDGDGKGIIKPTAFAEYFPDCQNAINASRHDLPEIKKAIQTGIDLGPMPFSQVEDRTLAEGVWDAWVQLRQTFKRNKETETQSRTKALFRAAIMEYKEPKEQGQTKQLSHLHSSRRRHAFDANIPGLAGGDNSILLPDFGSILKGNWRICVCAKTPNEDELSTLTKGNLETMGVIVLVMGRTTVEERNAVYHYSLKEKRRVIVIDETLMLYALCQKRFRFMTTMEVAQAFSFANPFLDHGNQGVPVEMFVGRREERQQILSPHGSFLMYGGRRLGKTALLQFMSQQQNLEQDTVAAYISMHHTESQNLWEKASKEMPREIFPEPVTTSDKFERKVRNWLDKDGRRRILLLVDESNDFIKDDQKEGNFKTLMAIIGLMNTTGRRFKTVFAGLQNIARAVQEVENSPISHLEQNVLAIGPLTGKERGDAEKLVTKALAGMGYHFAHRHDIWRILNFCLYYPVLIQLFCSVLVERLIVRGAEADPDTTVDREIGTQLVEDLLSDPKTLERIRDAFDKTLALDGERYLLIALIVAYQAIENSSSNRPNVGMTPREILMAAGEYWPQTFGGDQFTVSDMSAMATEMQNLGVLKPTGSNRWTLRSRSLQTMLGDQDKITDDLASFAEKPRPVTFDVKLRRRTFDTPPPNARKVRSPLTTGDMNRILKTGPKISVITGLDIAGIQIVEKAIEDMITTEYAATDQRLTHFKGRSADDLYTRLRDMRKTRSFMIVTHENWGPDWVRAAYGRKAVVVGDMRVIFIGGKKQSRMWAANERAMSEDSVIGHYPLFPWRRLETDTFLQQAHNTQINVDQIYVECGGWNLPMSTLFPDSSVNTLTITAALKKARKEVAALSMADFGINESAEELLKAVLKESGCTATNAIFDEDDLEIVKMELPDNPTECRFLIAYLKTLGVAEPVFGGGDREKYRLNPVVADRILSSGDQR